MPKAFYFEEIDDYVIDMVELFFQDIDNHDEYERSSQADYERLADRFNA
jgi:hypothetical protein